jgi:ubiquinone/menaquinone biosynthesis C-methylase UbiE
LNVGIPILKIDAQMDFKELKSIKQFNKWSKNYDRKLYWPFYFSNKAILQSIVINKDASVLDVGCGTGILLQQLFDMNNNLKLYGIDISPEMVKMAKKKLNPSICIKVSSVNQIPHNDNTFNFITCSTSFHHYSEPQKALMEMYRVLKNEGKLIVLDPFTNGLLRLKICAILNVIFKENDTCLFTKEEMRKMFVKAGFSTITQKTYIVYYKLLTIGRKQ